MNNVLHSEHARRVLKDLPHTFAPGEAWLDLNVSDWECGVSVSRSRAPSELGSAFRFISNPPFFTDLVYGRAGRVDGAQFVREAVHTRFGESGVGEAVRQGVPEVIQSIGVKRNGSKLKVFPGHRAVHVDSEWTVHITDPGTGSELFSVNLKEDLLDCVVDELDVRGQREGSVPIMRVCSEQIARAFISAEGVAKLFDYKYEFDSPNHTGFEVVFREALEHCLCKKILRELVEAELCSDDVSCDCEYVGGGEWDCVCDVCSDEKSAPPQVRVEIFLRGYRQDDD